MQADPNSTYVPFRDGITVRSTSIADARPALRVGKPVPGTPAIPGVSNFGITRLLWQSLPEGHAVRLTIGAGGELTPTAGVPGAGQLAQPALIVATNLVPSAVATNLPGPGFVPIYDQSISVGKSLVIGYGFAQIDNVTAASLDITKTAFVIASANASALLAGALPPIPPTELDQVLSANRSLKTSNDGALLAPVLVR